MEILSPVESWSKENNDYLPNDTAVNMTMNIFYISSLVMHQKIQSYATIHSKNFKFGYLQNILTQLFLNSSN